ncbi:ChaB family protein [Nocardia asteroides]|uniref:ChaB family protein n=1 Tax=Nocardia asteroides TaxID=1824 RepID=UPI001E37C283|nr:ChaB family protein [Nocardia asteroides]UGT60959.1 ChaB family protein [Nocardia asteroides]
MPKTNAEGKVKKSELPSTVRRSPAKAQRTFAEAHDSALESYDGDESRAYRVGYSALKHSYEKVGDHWEAKEQRGPSDEHAERRGLNTGGATAEGVNANATKKHLLEVAGRLGITGRWRMRKDELVDAVQRANRRATAAARE